MTHVNKRSKSQLLKLFGIPDMSGVERKPLVDLGCALQKAHAAAQSRRKENAGEPGRQEPIGAQHHAGATAMRTPGPDRVLKLEHKSVSLILSGVKAWEIRSRPTYFRGRIGIIPPPYPPDNMGDTPSGF